MLLATLDARHFFRKADKFFSRLAIHCVKIFQIRIYFWSAFSCIRTEYEPEVTPYLDTFHAVIAGKVYETMSRNKQNWI